MTRRTGLIALISFVLLAASIPVVSAQELPWREELETERATTTILVGDEPLEVELSVEPWQTSLGLGYRNGLPDDRGMLFVFPDAGPRSFWMQGMRFCIDIIWVNEGVIIGAYERVCPDPEGTPDAEKARYPSGQDVQFVLETPAGWLEEHGHRAGTPVEIPDGVVDLVQ